MSSAVVMDKLVRASRNYAYCGLLGGVYWRELTRHLQYDPRGLTQLRVVHTHCLALGTLFLLLVLLLERAFVLSARRNFRRFYAMYNAGLGVTLTVMLVHGTLMVLERRDTRRRWLSYTAGVGHALLGAGFYYFFDVLAGAVRAHHTSHSGAKNTHNNSSSNNRSCSHTAGVTDASSDHDTFASKEDK